MGTKRVLQGVDPLFLPVGYRVGPWRVKAWRGRGAYGTLYCVERAGHEEEGEFALKLAISPGDVRFAREAELLSRISSPYVPRFQDQGLWHHPAAVFPYVVMEWVEGRSLYEWSARCNPTSRQVLRLLAQVARALEATHAAGGVHRDVKGDNVLVRLVDGRAFLTDFGAGHYRGAATLTSKLLPPGTPEYRSPEAWAFVNEFLRHPTAHYPASASDDLFALGVTAYRLVTDEYPPPTQPGESGSAVWHPGGMGARPTRELNPRVSPGLDALITRLLAVAPVERFGGRPKEAAERLEYAEQGEGPEADELLFRWSTRHHPRFRSPERVRFVAEQDAVAREELAREQLKARSRARAGHRQARPWRFASVRRTAVGAGLLLAGLVAAVWLGVHGAAQLAADSEAHKGGRVAVGDSATTVPAKQDTELTDEEKRAVAAPMPEQPFPGQSKAPCKRMGEVEIQGGCWYRLPDAKPPCKEKGKEDAFEWKGTCYGPAYPYGRREPTSNPP